MVILIYQRYLNCEDKNSFAEVSGLVTPNKSLHLTARRLPLINLCWYFPRCVLVAGGR